MKRAAVMEPGRYDGSLYSSAERGVRAVSLRRGVIGEPTHMVCARPDQPSARLKSSPVAVILFNRSIPMASEFEKSIANDPGRIQ